MLRNPQENLDGLTARPGLVAVVAVLFGSTAFESFKDSARWLRFSQNSAGHGVLLNSVGLAAFCGIVFMTITIASVATAGLGHVDRRDLPGQLAHSVIPIVVGCIVAHYLSFFVSTGIATLQQLGDPLSRGWRLTSWLDGLNKCAIYSHPTALAVIKVMAVVTGHILGVIAAHDRAVRLLPRRHSVTAQLPMLTLMVAYTLAGLWLLFSHRASSPSSRVACGGSTQVRSGPSR